ncbi:HTTM domain-containing protein [Reichenbachiella sp. MALMAid0571]|uniref:HTTM domain-containing protein n=1 Tax=Reichenbachiella sp. MALMAid0571 TaxID=3143939 RepID=UPI0032DFCA2D
MTGIKAYYQSLNSKVSLQPLIIFRIAFGLLMVASQIRFLLKGWVKELYLAPKFHFTYPGFSWITPLPEVWMYSLVVATILLALCVSLGLFYRISIILFFLSFTYLELIDKSFYLNHYYFVSLISFLLIFLPANGKFSLDTILFPHVRKTNVTKWLIEIIKWQICLTYIFAGIAKINYDWLILAQPLKIWLSARTDTPIVGSFFNEPWVAYLFSWTGMVYDLTIAFFLLKRKTRPYAFVFVIIFHLMTWTLFNIGMFPFIMIFSALIFFDEKDWKKIFFKQTNVEAINERKPIFLFKTKSLQYIMTGYFIIQIILPLRHHLYKGNLRWTEEGYRFAWHVMVVEKTGYCEFIVKDKDSQKNWTVHPSQYLTKVQEKQMSFQPDMIWQFAKYLESDFKEKGIADMSINVKNFVSLNGRKSQPLVDPNIDLTEIESEFQLSEIIVKEEELESVELN